VRGVRGGGTVSAMEGRDPERDRDLDDWFDEPDTSPPLPRRGSRRAASGAQGIEDSWVVGREPGTRARRQRPGTIVVAGRTLGYGQAAVVLLALVAVILALLAAFGAFSSGGQKATTLPITTPRVTTPTTTTPTPTAPATVPVPTATLKPGDTGAQVKQLQRALAAAGYSPGAIDGSYGPGTKAAVAKFQSAHGLTADGIAGPKTLAALRQAVAQSG
jgi:hypothetical protein